MTAKQLAYGTNFTGTSASTYRSERGIPFLRRGSPVVVIPRFKGLNIYPQSPGTTPPVFQQTITNANAATAGTRTRWPIGPGKQVTSGS